MKNDLISRLASSHKGWETFESRKVFLLKWSGLFVIFFFGNLAWMPWREGAVNDFSTLMFNIENFAWLGLSLSSAVAFYDSVFPDRGLSAAGKIAFSLFIILLVETVIFREAIPVSHWLAETTTVKGRCGLIISLFAILMAPVFVRWARKGAPRNAGLTGVLAALTSASMASLLMQIVCVEDHSFHVIFWHFLPLTFACYASYFFSKKILHW